MRCMAVAIMGLPNAGKSTLLNRMVGSRISIITPKAQTTRNSIRGISNVDDCQLIFIDTPGILFAPKFKGQENLHKEMMQEAWNGLTSSEMGLILVDSSSKYLEENFKIIDKLKKEELPGILVLNKVDKVKPPVLLEQAKMFNDYHDFKATFMISAAEGTGVKDLKKYLAKAAPDKSWIYAEDMITDAPARFIAAEITREQIFLKFNEEVPYFTAIETEKWEENEKKIIIHQVIYVARESQKKIIVGHRGAAIKEIGEKSRKILQDFFGVKVNLFLFVKSRDDWASYATRS